MIQHQPSPEPDLLGFGSERFWSKVNRSDPAGCWVWLGYRHYSGYGQYAVRSGDHYVIRQAHRVAYELAGGVLLPGQLVCHRCDNRACVNPGHLFVGSTEDNVRDRTLKIRSRRKLEPEDVRAIRAAYAAGGLTHAALAKTYGVSAAAIGQILRRQTWAHLS